jgi:hypothetical protein
MSYYLHAFCTDAQVPTIGTILQWAADRGVSLTGEPGSPPWTAQELAARCWDSIGLWYRPDRSPLLVTVSRAGDPGHLGRIAAGTVDDVLARLGDVVPGPARDKVMEHLRRSRLVVAVSMPVSALREEDVWNAATVLLDYFVQHQAGLVHVEEEGFYQADVLVLPTDW